MKIGFLVLLAALIVATGCEAGSLIETPVTAEPAPAAQETGVEQASSGIGSLRNVDFRNGFRYPSSHLDGLVPAVVDGRHTNGTVGDADFYVFSVGEPVFVDLDGDRVEEAALRASWNGGGSGRFDELLVFALVEGEARLAADPRMYGDRAFGGIAGISASDEAVAVDLYTDGEGACCPTSLSTEHVGLADGRLVTLASGPALRVVSVHPADPEPQPVRFLPGTSSAVIEFVLSDADQVVHFEAAAGQRLDLRLLSGPAPRYQLTHRATNSTSMVSDTVSDTRAGGATGGMGLWEDGDYLLAFAATERVGEGSAVAQPSRVLLSIVSERASLHDRPGWRSDVRAATLDDPSGPIRVTAAFPVFDDAPTANDTIATWVDAQVDPWISYASESATYANESTTLESESEVPRGEFEMHHRVTMVADQLISIEFSWYEYVCCRPYPNYGYRSLVFNPASGDVLDDVDIVDLGRLREIEALWFDALAISEEWRTDTEPSFHFGGSDTPGWSSLTISPHGLTFGTDRAGALPPTATFVSFVDLGPLVNTDVVRAASALLSGES